MRTGVQTPSSRRRRQTSKPSMPGSIRSRMIASYSVACARASASSPLPATSAAMPSLRRPRLIRPAILTWSSTIRTRIASSRGSVAQQDERKMTACFHAPFIRVRNASIPMPANEPRRLQMKVRSIAAAAVLTAMAAGCGSSGGGSSSSTSAAVTPPSDLAPVQGRYAPSIDPANFVAGIDNRYFPLKPGTGFHYVGVAEDGKTPQTDDEVVTHQTKTIMGVDATVVRDTVSSRGRPIEKTFDWYAQDKDGNVW